MATQILRPIGAGSRNNIDSGGYADADPGDPVNHGTSDSTHLVISYDDPGRIISFDTTVPAARISLTSVVSFCRAKTKPEAGGNGAIGNWGFSHGATWKYWTSGNTGTGAPGGAYSDYSYTSTITAADLDNSTLELTVAGSNAYDGIRVAALWAEHNYVPVAGGMITFFSLLAPLLGASLSLADMHGIAREMALRTDYRITPSEYSRALGEYRSWTRPAYSFGGVK